MTSSHGKRSRTGSITICRALRRRLFFPNAESAKGATRRCTLLFLYAVSAFQGAQAAENSLTSELWGRRGEKWSATGRLPDFSYAGYHRGERPLPVLKHKVSVKDFGAVGDGKANDTEAFQRAIDQSRGQTILVPAGRYLITDFLTIRHSHTRLLGEGPRESVLYFPTPLETIKPNMGATTSGKPTSNYSWSGGFVTIVGSLSRAVLSDVTAFARRGDRWLAVSDPQAFKVGQDVRLSLQDTGQQTLATYLYAGDPGPMKNLKSRAQVQFLGRVTEIDREGRRIQVDRPLRTEVRREWRPRLYDAASSVEEVGIENLGFEFPVTAYGGHFSELGYNAVAMRGVRNCWVRDISIRHADSGLFISGNNVTLHNITFSSARTPERQRRATGHHGVTLGGQDNLLDGFRFDTRFMHDITVTRGSAGNVVCSGSGVDICLDHHRYGPHANCFTDIDLGEGSRMFQSGGGAALGRHSAAWETFWCIRARQSQRWPDGWGPDLMNLVAVQPDQTVQPGEMSAKGRWLEAIDPSQFQPRNLYRAQLDRRLGGIR